MYILIAKTHESAIEGLIEGLNEEVRAGDGARTRRSACLEGRRLLHRRSFGIHRPYIRLHAICLHCERAWQKMSRAIFSPFGKTCHMFFAADVGKKRCEQLGTGCYAAVYTIPSLLTFRNGF